jgi:hypothetical protein
MAERADSMPAAARSYRTIKAIEALQVIQHRRRGGGPLSFGTPAASLDSTVPQLKS